MEIQGKILVIGDVRQVSEKFKTRDVVVQYAENPIYPETIKFELVQDKVDLIDNFKVGDTVDVHFNLRGRANTNTAGVTNYFNSLVIWRLVAGANENVESGSEAVMAGEGDSDSLPF